MLAFFTVQSNVLVGVTSARLALRPVSFDTDAAEDLREVEADLPGRQAIGIQREHNLINLSEPALTFVHDHRLERAVPIPRHINCDMASRAGQHGLGSGAVPHVPGVQNSRPGEIFQLFSG